MSPAVRRRPRGFKTSKRRFGKVKILFVFLLILEFSSLLLRKSIWRGSSNLSLVIAKPQGEVLVSTFDRKNEKITNIVIPGSTQLNVSRELGSWKARSIWQLGEQEGLGGRLLAETIVKNFSFPISGWGDASFAGFAEGRLASMVKALFSSSTNLGVADRFRLLIFSLGVKTLNRVTIDLSQGPYLKKVKLVDGELGYSVTGVGLERLYGLFFEPEISSKGLRIEIVDKSGEVGLSENLAKTIEVLGAKVASVEKEETARLDCLVSGRNETLVRKMMEVYSCEKVGEDGSNYDMEITIGEEFAKRF